MRRREGRNVKDNRLDMKIHTQIKQARTEANLSQQQLADKAGIKQAQISMLESGKVKPSIDMLQSLSTALNCHFKITPE